jgi:hypothetical protein
LAGSTSLKVNLGDQTKPVSRVAISVQSHAQDVGM